jgi:predicted DNA-binding protein (MmcQ/YjbR family)
MAKDISQAVREVCLSFPEAEEFLSHGSPNFRVRGKTFATYVVNHHGDGRIALWINAPDGAQEQHVRADPKRHFVPPYVGPRGWLGVNLDQGLSWTRVAGLVREAYEKTAPRTLSATIGKTVAITPPTTTLAADEIDPLQTPRAQKLLSAFRERCLALPETSEDRQFGYPVWRAGKKTFASIYAMDKRIKLMFWTGIDRQGLYTTDPRYTIPPYMGHNGWIQLDVTTRVDWNEVDELMRQSYRHFALKRMLAALDGDAPTNAKPARTASRAGAVTRRR